MPTQIGSLTKFAWRREALIYGPAWPPTTILTTDILPLISDATYDLREIQPYVGAADGIGNTTQDITAKPIISSVELEAYYHGLDGLLAATFGHEALRIGSTTMPESLGSGVYRHLYELDVWHDGPWRVDDGFLMDQGVTMDQHKTCRGTTAIDKQVAIWEFNGMSVNGWSWDSASGREALLTLAMLGYQLTEPATINASLANHPTLVSPSILHQHLTFSLGPFSTITALNASNVIGLTEFSLSIDNRLAFDFGPLTQLSPGEIQRIESPPLISVGFTIPRYSADTVLNWHRNQTLLMGHAKYTAAVNIPGSSTPWTLRWYFPSCRVRTLTYVTKARVPSFVGTLELFSPSAAPAGFPAVSHADGALFAETIGQVSAHQML